MSAHTHTQTHLYKHRSLMDNNGLPLLQIVYKMDSKMLVIGMRLHCWSLWEGEAFCNALF